MEDWLGIYRDQATGEPHICDSVHTAVSAATSLAINSLQRVPLGPIPIPTFAGNIHAGYIYSGSILIMIEKINFSL
jgi:hypothetical protein